MIKSNSLTTLVLSASLSVLMLFLISTSGFAAKTKSTMEIPEGSSGMIGYGTLISLQSMEQTLKHKYEGSVHQVHLTGYERAWTCLRPNRVPLFFFRNKERVPFMGVVQLNIQPKKEARINCILYLTTNEELLRFDKRELGYRRVDVTDKIEEFRFRGGKVYVYEGLPPNPDRLSPDKGTYIVIKEQVDQVASACDSIGKDFRREFDKSIKPCAYEVVSFKQITWEKAK